MARKSERHLTPDVVRWRGLVADPIPWNFVLVALSEAADEVERLRGALNRAALGLEMCSVGGRFDQGDVIDVYDGIRDALGDEYPGALE